MRPHAELPLRHEPVLRERHHRRRPVGDVLRHAADRRRPLLADVPKFVSTPELRVDVPDERKFALVEEAVRHFKRTHEVVEVDGARVLFGDGWGLIRASNTQPILVTRYEALTPERRDAIRAEMEGWLRSQGVDPTPGVGH